MIFFNNNIENNVESSVAESLDKLKKRYKRRFPDIVEIMAVSCKTKKGIKELQQTIVEVVEKRKLVGQKVPVAWIALSRQVEMLTTRRQPPFMVRSHD